MLCGLDFVVKLKFSFNFTEKPLSGSGVTEVIKLDTGESVASFFYPRKNQILNVLKYKDQVQPSADDNAYRVYLPPFWTNHHPQTLSNFCFPSIASKRMNRFYHFSNRCLSRLCSKGFGSFGMWMKRGEFVKSLRIDFG